MRKQLLALLSALGLAGSSSPASAQVKGTQAQPDTKSESTMKRSKTVQEDAASKDASKLTKAAQEQAAAGRAADIKYKGAKTEASKIKSQAEYKERVSSAEGGHATSDVVTEKMRKAGGEQTLQDAHSIKIVKGKAEANASHKKVYSKATRETNSVKTETLVKGEKTAANSGAVQSEAAKKANQASPK